MNNINTKFDNINKKYNLAKTATKEDVNAQLALDLLIDYTDLAKYIITLDDTKYIELKNILLDLQQKETTSLVTAVDNTSIQDNLVKLNNNFNILFGILIIAFALDIFFKIGFNNND